MERITEKHERWLATTSLLLLMAFVATMHLPGLSRSDLCLKLTNGETASDALCLMQCCAVGIAALGAIATIWYRGVSDS